MGESDHQERKEHFAILPDGRYTSVWATDIQEAKLMFCDGVEIPFVSIVLEQPPLEFVDYKDLGNDD